MPPSRSNKAAPKAVPLTDDYDLGEFLGKGAFGAVYAVARSQDGGNTIWACKMAPEQTQSKKKKTPVDRLHYESIMYTQQLSHLAGTMIPKTPAPKDRLKPYYDSLNGNHCLLIERMQCEMLHSVRAVVEAYRGSGKTTIPFAPLALRLIDLVEAIHKSKNILLDVKPDNLMVDMNVKLSKGLTTEALAKSIRLVDLGLLKPFYGPDGDHTPNLPTGGVQGTPLYASLHVHDLQTPSRRDDLYSMVLVIADLFLHIHGVLNHKEPPYGTGKSASYLPWSQEASDSAIGKVKTTHLNDRKSPFFASLPSPAIATAFFSALQLLHQTDFARLPNFDATRKLFTSMQIPIPEASKLPAMKPSKKRVALDDVPIAGSSPLRRSTRHTTQDAASLPKYTMPPIEDVEMEDSDVAVIDEDEENLKPSAKSKRNGFQLIVTDGRNNMQERIVLNSTNTTITIGSSAKKSSVVLTDLSPAHVRLSLSKNNTSVFVEPLGKSVVQVNRMDVGKTGTMAFIGQSISFGVYAIAAVQSLPAVDDDDPMIIDPPGDDVKKTASSRVGKKMKVIEVPPAAISEENSDESVSKKKATLMLNIISPIALMGSQFALEEGQTLVFGSDAASQKLAKVKEQYIHFDQPDVAPRHISLSLVIQRGTLMVEVRDLKSATGTFVNHIRVPAGKSQMAFANNTIRIGGITMVVRK